MFIIKNHPIVSVILASYNHEKYVKKAILSVFDQDVKRVELIIVDDGSTDNTANVIKKIKDARITFVHLKENRQMHPRNLALRMAKGRFIAFQNSDDIWGPTKLHKQLEILEKKITKVVRFIALKNNKK